METDFPPDRVEYLVYARMYTALTTWYGKSEASVCYPGVRGGEAARFVFKSRIAWFFIRSRGWKMDGWKRVGRRHLTWSMLPIYLVARFSTLAQNWKFISGPTDHLLSLSLERFVFESWFDEKRWRERDRSRERVFRERSREWMIMMNLLLKMSKLWDWEIVERRREVRVWFKS